MAMTLQLLNLQLLFAVASALFGATAVYQVSSGVFRVGRGAASALSSFATAGDTGASSTPAAVGSERHKIRLAFQSVGLDAAGREEIAQWLARIAVMAACGVGLFFSGLPKIAMLVAASLGWMIVGGWIDGVWRKKRLAVEKELPTFLSRLASVSQVAPNAIDALTEVADTLDPGAPLKEWIERFAAKLQAAGQTGLAEMIDEAYVISPSLGVTAFEIGRLWETGGAGYAAAFSSAADNLSGILESRAVAASKGEGARGSIRSILLALLGAVVLMTSNPYTQDALRRPIFGLFYLALFAWIGYGWFSVNRIIDESVA